jgi:type IV fimbrial biogenesis protein FimT
LLKDFQLIAQSNFIMHTNNLRLTNSQYGFTLIELMVTIAVLSILITIAVPSFSSIIASNRVTTTTNDLFGSLTQAKSEAIRRGNRVTICPSTDGVSCQTGTTTWAVGWITFLDTSRDTNPVVDAGENILQINQFTNTGIVLNGSIPYASFASDGTSKLISGAFQNGKIRVCSKSSSLTNDNRARDINLLRTGRISITKPTGVSADCEAS